MFIDSKLVKHKESLFGGIPMASSNVLKLCNSNLNDESCLMLADHLEKNYHLERIEIINCNISDKGFSYITSSIGKFNNLNILVVKGNNIGENFNEFNNNCLRISKLHSLEHIDFSQNKIKNECYTGIKSLILSENLKSLILSDNLIDKESADSLFGLAKFSNLKIQINENNKFEEIKKNNNNVQKPNENQQKEILNDYNLSDVPIESEPFEPENFDYMSSPERKQIELSIKKGNSKIKSIDKYKSPIKEFIKPDVQKSKIFPKGKLEKNEKKLVYELESQILEDEKKAIKRAAESENRNFKDLMEAQISEKEINIRKLNLLIQQISNENSNLKDSNFVLEEKIIKLEKNYLSQFDIEKEKHKKYKEETEALLIEVKGQNSVLINEIKRMKIDFSQKDCSLNFKAKEYEKLNIKFLALTEKFTKEIEQLKNSYRERESFLESALNDTKLQIKDLKEKEKNSLKSLKNLFESSVNSFTSQLNDFSSETFNKLDQLSKALFIIEKKKEELSIQNSTLLSNSNRQKANYELQISRIEKEKKGIIDNLRQNLMASCNKKMNYLATSREEIYNNNCTYLDEIKKLKIQFRKSVSHYQAQIALLNDQLIIKSKRIHESEAEYEKCKTELELLKNNYINSRMEIRDVEKDNLNYKIVQDYIPENNPLKSVIHHQENSISEVKRSKFKKPNIKSNSSLNTNRTYIYQDANVNNPLDNKQFPVIASSSTPKFKSSQESKSGNYKIHYI